MGSDLTHPSHSAQVIDLGALSGPARRVLALYDLIQNGQSPTAGEFDDALRALRNVTRPPGRLGRDITLLVDGASGATKRDIADAFERLRLITAINPRTPTQGTRRTRRRRRQLALADQQQLPGIFEQLTAGAKS